MRTYAFMALVIAFIVPSVVADIISTRENMPGVPIRIKISAGKQWKHTIRIAGFIPVKNSPQIAVWAETPEGDFITTLYVTHRSAIQDWRGGNVRRPESLPYCSHRRGVRYSDGFFMPPKDDPLPDTETAATPKNGFTLESHLAMTGESVVVFVEVNHSFDANDSFPEKDNQVNGQPSAIYRTVVDCQTLPSTAVFALAGYGSPDGSDGDLHTDIKKLTTGKEIVGNMTVTLEKE